MAVNKITKLVDSVEELLGQVVIKSHSLSPCYDYYRFLHIL